MDAVLFLFCFLDLDRPRSRWMYRDEAVVGPGAELLNGGGIQALDEGGTLAGLPEAGRQT